jgi:hypothetical protein
MAPRADADPASSRSSFAVHFVGDDRHLDARDDLIERVDDVEVVHAIGAGDVTPHDQTGGQEQGPDEVRCSQFLWTGLSLRHADNLGVRRCHRRRISNRGGSLRLNTVTFAFLETMARPTSAA